MEQGQHTQLLEHQGLYAEMWNTQEFGSSAALPTEANGLEEGSSEGSGSNDVSLKPA